MNGIDKTKLLDQTIFRLNEIKKLENYFSSEINQRKLCSKNLNKYVTTFDYIDKVLIVLNATTGGVCITSQAYFGCYCRNSKCCIYCCKYLSAASIFFSNRNNEKIVKNNKKQKEKASLASSKLNNIEALLSQALEHGNKS